MADRFPSRVSLEDVSRTFGRTFALHRLNLQLHAGCITGVVGDNGAGKTTLLNLLATVDAPTSGRICYDDATFRRFRRHARHRIGWISHSSLLYDELTARENLEFYGQMYGVDDLHQRTDSWLHRVGLADDADRRVRAFSRGMKQRLTIARALVHNPQLLLFDEPATGLDQQGNRFVVELLDQLRQRNRLVIIVSHDFSLLEGLIDRLIILRRGKISWNQPVDNADALAETYRSYA